MSDLLIDTDHTLTVDGLQSSSVGFLNAATVQATLYEANGTTEVPGQTWPLTLAYVASSSGKYQGQLSDQVQIANLHRYVLEVTAEQGDSKRTWRTVKTARYGGF